MARKRKKSGGHVDESWLLPYSDLLTLLVALFIVLFASSEVDQQKYEDLANVFRSEFSGGAESILDESDSMVPSDTTEDSGTTEDPANEELPGGKSEEEVIEDDRAEGELLRLEQVEKEVQHYIEENNLEDQFGTRLTDEGLMIRILNDVFFDSGSAQVKQEGRTVATDVAELLKTDPAHQIVISGHADDVPIGTADYGSNWELSLMRALNFMQLIIENASLDPTLFSAKGHGEYDPIVPNTTEENRAQNRRVEILILPNYDIDTGTVAP